MGDITSNLANWWKLDDASGSTAIDSTGASNATLVNSPSWIAGPVGGALSFDSASSQYGSAAGVALNGLTVCTLAGWMKRSVSNARVAFGVQSGSGNRFSIYYWDAGSVYIRAGGNSSYATFSVNDTNWHHFVLVFDGSQVGNSGRLKVYLDGNPISPSYSGTIASSISVDTSTFTFGRDVANSAYSNGALDDMRIYNRALTADDVTDLFNYTGDLSGDIDGSSTGVGTASGTLTGLGALSGSLAGTGAGNASLVGSGALAGSLAGVGSLSGLLSGAGVLSGSAAGVGDSTATLLALVQLAGSASGVASSSGALQALLLLSGAASGSSTVSGALTFTNYDLGGLSFTVVRKNRSQKAGCADLSDLIRAISPLLTGPQGAQGAQGIQGPQGPQGPKGRSVYSLTDMDGVFISEEGGVSISAL